MSVNCAIIIPVYKPVPDRGEEFSFRNCTEKLSKYPIYLVVPEDLDIDKYALIYKSLKIKRFPNNYFKGLEGYNSLLLSKLFYNSFIEYEYILIHQLDAIVFSDNLIYWLNKGFDYIGAPWIKEKNRIFLNIAIKVSILEGIKYYLSNGRKSVGNGGLSIRKIKSFLKVFDHYNSNTINWKANEDYFWSFFARYDKDLLRKPSYKEAIQFAFEMYPSKLYKENNNRLPFGAHACEKYDPDFWKTHLEGLVSYEK